MKSLIQISLFSIFSSIVCANPEKIALRDLIQGEKTDGAYIYLHRPEKPNGSAIVICPEVDIGVLSWVQRDMALQNG